MLKTDIFIAESVTDVITRVRMPGNVFTYIAEGRDRAAVIDTGCGLGPFRDFAEERLNGKPYDVILTHGHVDHAGGASEFDAPYLQPADIPIAAEHTRKERRAEYIRRSYPDPFTEADMPAPAADGFARLETGRVFDLGGEQLEIVCMGGHTPGSVGILFRQERILLAGDACCSFTLLFGGGQSTSVRTYRNNLQDLRDRYDGRFDTMLYSHPHNYGGPEVIGQMIRLCDEILAGRDDRIEIPGPFGPALLAKATGPDQRRLDGVIANLLYTAENLLP